MVRCALRNNLSAVREATRVSRQSYECVPKLGVTIDAIILSHADAVSGG